MRFAEALIKTAAEVPREHKATWAAAVGVTVVLMLWVTIWVSCSLVIIRVWNSGVLGWLVYIFNIFILYWCSEVIKNVTHVTIAGSAAAWYFQGSTAYSNPTMAAFYRSVSFSFGSICFGSLIVAILTTIRHLLRLMRSPRQRNLVVLAIACIASLILMCVETLLRIFNKCKSYLYLCCVY